MITAIRHLSCARHETILVEYAEQRILTPDAAAALVHAERCARCAAELRATLLVVAQLRRLAATAGTPAAQGRARGRTVSADQWTVVRRRITSTRESRPSWSNPFTGPILAAGILAAVLAWGGRPVAFAGPATDWEERAPGAGPVVMTVRQALPAAGGVESPVRRDSRAVDRPIYEPAAGPGSESARDSASGPALGPVPGDQKSLEPHPAVSPRGVSFEAL